MIENAIGLVLLGVGLVAVVLQRLYSSVPVRELKRLAKKGDLLAATLYRVTAYGPRLRLLLWIIASGGVAAGLALIVPSLAFLLGLAILAVTLVLALVVLPSIQLTQHTAQLAAWFVPAIHWLLIHSHVFLEKITTTTSRFRELPPHSRLYEKEDLLDLLVNQKNQADNRISEEDLDLMTRALQFRHTSAANIFQPRKEVHVVDADDSIGPILLDQLHKKHQASFLVYKDSKENIIGTLAMNDAVTAKHGGRVFDLIRNDLIYVHEDFSARQVLTAFHKTGHQIAAVINNAEEFMGVVTASHLLQVLLGDSLDEDVSYADRAVIAAYRPKKESSAADSTDTDEKTNPEDQVTASSPEATEVIE